MVGRRDIVVLSFILLLGSINSLYGMFDIGVLSDFTKTQALVGASTAWFLGYVYIKGDTWSESGKLGKALMVGSWFLLVGMAYTEAVPELVSSNAVMSYVAGSIHIASFYNVGFRDKKR